MTDIRLTVQGLAVDYPTARVVDNVSFTLGNERLALVGESGSGKSMTARALMGLVRKPGVVSAERLEVLGRDVLTLSARGWRELRGNDIAMVLQDPRYALNPVQSIQTQLEEALTLHQRLSRRARAEAVKDAIAAVGLDLPVLSRYPGELSGGMGQRVMIALALLNNPKVLIADEPTSALDARLRNQILELLVEQCAQRQMAMLLISHDLPLVAAHCDRVLVMYQGRQVDEMPARAAAERDAPLHPHPVDLPAKCAYLRPDAADPRQNPGLYGDSPWRSLIFRIYRLHSARRRRSPPPVSVSTPGKPSA
ncbi:putative ABC transport system oligopeptide translocator [Klebsiella pneumoniae subsp. pneumoniae KpMDU1]|nr:putative ABC transport system oligopeptide translocator [Klebsiella pneumoniae subsp. pneumoniae KpMDU1]